MSKKRPASELSQVGNTTGQSSAMNGISNILNPVERPQQRLDASPKAVKTPSFPPGMEIGQSAGRSSYSPGYINGLSNTSDWSNMMANPTLQSSPGNLYSFDSLPLGVSCVNWMSPSNPMSVDWDTQLAHFSVNNNNLDTRMAGFPFFFDTIGTSEAGYQAWNPTLIEARQDASIVLNQEQDNGGCFTPTPSQSMVESGHSASTEGRLYVDGACARAPFGGQANHRGSTLNNGDPGPLCTAGAVSAADIEYVCNKIRAECQNHGIGNDLASSISSAYIELCVRLYFENFHAVFPFLRKSSFSRDVSRQWILLLAVAAVGSRYSHPEARGRSGDILSLLLRKLLVQMFYGLQVINSDGALYVPGDTSVSRACPDIHLLQAGILNIILMLHSGRSTLIERALTERHQLLVACSRLGLLSQTPLNTTLDGDKSEDTTISRWLKQEAEARTGLMVFFLDTMVMFQFNEQPLMRLDNVSAVLPSREDIWESPNAGAIKSIEPRVTVKEAVEMLYMEKRLPPHLGEFSTTILINAIYRRTKEAVLLEKAPLQAWTPTATVQPRPKRHQVNESWPPASPTLSRWRNSACDCLDILHWSANGKAARRLGLEHHTILYLHLARLLILTPIAHIQIFASSSWGAQQGRQPDERYVTARSQVLQWAVRDQFKARLSIIHCGALFWHVRRYSRDSVVEPFAIYMATLVLWAYCVSTQFVGHTAIEAYASQETPSTTSPNAPSYTNETEPEPSFMHLDRPLDDELVQMFVRLGYKMSGYIARVGNINDGRAPGKILLEGVRLLARGRDPSPKEAQSLQRDQENRPQHVWGIEASFIESLKRLVSATTDTAESG